MARPPRGNVERQAIGRDVEIRITIGVLRIDGDAEIEQMPHPVGIAVPGKFRQQRAALRDQVVHETRLAFDDHADS